MAWVLFHIFYFKNLIGISNGYRAAVQYIGKIYDDMELLQWGETNKVGR